MRGRRAALPLLAVVACELRLVVASGYILKSSFSISSTCTRALTFQNFCQVGKMRIMIKGGVWKNTEDEILKAAVMKCDLYTHT